MKMKKKLLSLLMVVMLIIPVVGIAGAGKVEAADVTGQIEYVDWGESTIENSIPSFSDSFTNWLFKEELGLKSVITPNTQDTLGPNSVLKIDWDKTTIPKDDIIGVSIKVYQIEKDENGEYELTAPGGEPYCGRIYDHPSYWGGDTDYTPTEPMNPKDTEGPYPLYEEEYYLADWIKQDTFPGLNMGKYYNELVEDLGSDWWPDKMDLLFSISVKYVKGENRERNSYKTFWIIDKPLDKYVSELKEPTESGEIEEVDLSTQESQTISNEDFNKLIEDNKEKDIVIKNKAGLSFTFPKGSLSAVEGKTEYDFGTTFVNEFTAGTLPSFVTASNFVRTISFGYSGKLPGKATIKIPLGAEYAGKTLYYSYVKESGLTETQQVTADAEGNITVTQDHCSDYVITTENPNPTQKSPQTGDNQNLSFLLILMVASAAIAGTIIMRKRTVK